MFIYEIVSEIIHSTKNTVNCAIIYPFHVISELAKKCKRNDCLQKLVYLNYKLKLLYVILTYKVNEINFKATFTSLFLYRV